VLRNYTTGLQDGNEPHCSAAPLVVPDNNVARLGWVGSPTGGPSPNMIVYLGLARGRRHVLKQTWYSELRRLIKERWRVGGTFTLGEVYQLEREFEPLYPLNSHRPESLRETLQRLIKAGSLERVDRGLYRRIDGDCLSLVHPRPQHPPNAAMLAKEELAQAA
jgi:DpnI-like restriction endonuclease